MVQRNHRYKTPNITLAKSNGFRYKNSHKNLANSAEHFKPCKPAGYIQHNQFV